MYHLLCCIVHKLYYKRNEPAHLLVVEYIQPPAERCAFLSKLTDYGWFDKITVIPERNIKMQHGQALTEDSKQDEIERVIANIIKAVDTQLNIDFHSFESIYVAGDHWAVGVYLTYNKIPFNYFEDASGMLSQHERYAEIIKNISFTNYIISKHIKGLGKSPVIIEKYANLRDQVEGFFDDRAVDFNITQLIKQLSESDTKKLLNMFNCDKYSVTGNTTVIFMTQYLKTMNIESLKEQERLTTLLIDYFAQPDQLFVKPHPKDKWINYNKLLPGSTVLENKLPSELLFLCFDKTLTLGLTASSTSIGGIRGLAERVVYFNESVETNYIHLHKVYAACIIIKLLKKYFSGFYCLGIESKQLNFMLQTIGEKKINVQHYRQDNSDNGACLVIGGLGGKQANDALDNLNQNDAAIIFDTAFDYSLCEKIFGFDNIVPVAINKSSGLKQAYNMDEEHVFVYTVDKRIKQEVSNLMEIKELPYTAITVNINAKLSPEQIKIKLLEAKVKALTYALEDKCKTKKYSEGK